MLQPHPKEFRRFYLSKPQYALVNSKVRYPAFVAGFGSGKTQGLCSRALYLKRKYKTCNVAYYMPTFDLIRQTIYPRFEEMLTEYGIPYKLNKSLAEFDLENCGKIICRTMDNPARIIAYEVADSFVDELDTLKHEDARAVWRKIIARNRQKKPDKSDNTVAVGTTPEGFRFVHEIFKKKPIASSELIHASTYSNQVNLPDNYIEDLRGQYPAQLIDAYIMGLFTNLASGSVYPNYDRVKNHSSEVIKVGDWLHIGMDFNVTKMAAVFHVYRPLHDAKGEIVAMLPHAVYELCNVYDTPDMIRIIRERFPKELFPRITIYPDSSGDSRKSVNASVTDIALLKGAGFEVLQEFANPRVKDRVLSVNAMLCNGKEERRYFINEFYCPLYADALEQQAYDENGEPDKKKGTDHPNDAAGYFIHKKHAVAKPNSQRATIVGV